MFTGTLRYNIEYPMRIRGMNAAERAGKTKELLEQVQLLPLAQAPAHKLSGGETQRAGIARALATGATVLLFDEPTANIDRRSRTEFMELIRSLGKDSRLSLLIATHDADLAARLCPRSVHLDNGRLVDRHVLSDGGYAWPTRLARRGETWIATAPLEARAHTSYTVYGITELAAGIGLRLAAVNPPFPSEAALLDLLLVAEDCRAQARHLALGASVSIVRSDADAGQAATTRAVVL
jgi:energy-coupling factor transporter ATP-binding protein EcfA2